MAKVNVGNFARRAKAEGVNLLVEAVERQRRPTRVHGGRSLVETGGRSVSCSRRWVRVG